jgi:TolB protein
MFPLILAAIVSLTSVNDSYPHQSRDGTKLVFHSDRGGTNALWMAEGDGTKPKPLFDGAAVGTNPVTPKFSPDGRHVAFAMTAAGSTDPSDIFVMDLATRDVRQLTRGMGDASHPIWSADGSRIFFSAGNWGDPKDGRTEQSEIYSVAPDGSDKRQHSRCNAVCTYPAPSPDGKWIAFRQVLSAPGRQWNQQPMAKNSEVMIAPMAGGPVRNLSNHEAFDGWPSFSPDGKWVAFASARQGQPNVGQIYLVRPDGSGLHVVTEGPLSHAQPSFSADGNTVLMYELYETDEFNIGHIARTAVVAAQ